MYRKKALPRRRKQSFLSEQEAQIEGRISAGCGEIVSVSVLPDLFAEFREKYPLVTFDIFTATADIVKERMDRGLVDIGILMEPIDMEKYDFIRFKTKERWVVLMRSDDPMTDKEYLAAQDLSELPLVLSRR